MLLQHRTTLLAGRKQAVWRLYCPQLSTAPPKDSLTKRGGGRERGPHHQEDTHRKDGVLEPRTAIYARFLERQGRFQRNAVLRYVIFYCCLYKGNRAFVRRARYRPVGTFLAAGEEHLAKSPHACIQLGVRLPPCVQKGTGKTKVVGGVRSLLFRSGTEMRCFLATVHST